MKLDNIHPLIPIKNNFLPKLVDSIPAKTSQMMPSTEFTQNKLAWLLTLFLSLIRNSFCNHL